MRSVEPPFAPGPLHPKPKREAKYALPRGAVWADTAEQQIAEFAERSHEDIQYWKDEATRLKAVATDMLDTLERVHETLTALGDLPSMRDDLAATIARATTLPATAPADGTGRDFWLQYDNTAGMWCVENEPLKVVRTGAEVIHTREVSAHPVDEPLTAVQRSVRDGTFGVRSVDEDDCPGHVASEANSKVCARCGVHIDSLRPDED